MTKSDLADTACMFALSIGCTLALGVLVLIDCGRLLWVTVKRVRK